MKVKVGMTQNRAKVLGITGGTGSGKSTVSSIIKHNIKSVVIDADKIGHRVIKKGQKAYFEIIAQFGKDILDDKQNIDRKKLGSIVFSSRQELDKLDNITLRYIKEEIIYLIEFFKKRDFKIIVLDAPLLIETKLNKLCDLVWLVESPKEQKIERLIKRTGMPREEIEKRINIQNQFEMRKQYADIVIENMDLEQLKQKIKRELKNVLY